MFRIFKQKETEVKLEDVPKFLNEKFKQEYHDIDGRINANVSDIKKNLAALRELAKELATKSSPHKYANTVKNKFCEKLLDNIDKVLTDNSTEWNAVLSLSREVVYNASDINLKEFRHLTDFKDDMSKISEKIRHAEDKIKASTKMLSESKVDKINVIKNNVMHVHDIKDKTMQLGDDIKNLERSIGMAEEDINIERNNLMNMKRDLESSYDRSKINALEASANDLKQKIGNEFSGLDRVFKKFIYYGDITKDEISILKHYSSDPAESFIHDKENSMRGVLDAINSYRDKDEIELDQRKLNKLHQLIRGFDFLMELRRQYDAMIGKIRDYENEIDVKSEPVRAAIKESTQRTLEIEKEISKMRDDLDSKAGEKKRLENEIVLTKNKVEISLAALSGSNIKVV